MMKNKVRTINTLPTLRSAKQEGLFWMGITFIFLIIFLLLSLLSAKQGKPMSFLLQTLWICIFVCPPLFLTIRSYLKIKQIIEFDASFLLRYGIITGHHEEDSVLGDQASVMVYWLYFNVNENFIFKQRVSLAAYHRLKPGDQIVVQVSPDNPHLCRAEIE
jgi:hypothetical protein